MACILHGLFHFSRRSFLLALLKFRSAAEFGDSVDKIPGHHHTWFEQLRLRLTCVPGVAHVDIQSCFWNFPVFESQLILSWMKPQSEAQKHPRGMKNNPFLLINHESLDQRSYRFHSGPSNSHYEPSNKTPAARIQHCLQNEAYTIWLPLKRSALFCIFMGRERDTENTSAQAPYAADLGEDRNFLTYLAGCSWQGAGSACMLNLG